MPAFEYKHVVTDDGSPTLCLPPTWEHMHAWEGAFTETQYIYQPTIEKAFNTVQNPIFLSLGLGLAYNEMLIGFESLKHDRAPELIASYESVEPLREAFTDWLKDKPVSLTPLYDQIAGLYSHKYERSTAEVKKLLLELLNHRKLRLEGPVEEAVLTPAHAILFDPFSSNTSPQLWTEEFLTRFFTRASAQPCFISTYASKGELKRALRANGFSLTLQKGFGKKRHSIFAVRKTVG